MMVKYRHVLHLVEGDLDSGHFQNVATLKYDGSLPSAPTKGLVVELSDLVNFEVAEVIYLPSEQIYETRSHVDLLDLEDRLDGYISRSGYAARFVKYGFTVMHTYKITAEEIDMEVASVKE